VRHTVGKDEGLDEFPVRLGAGHALARDVALVIGTMGPLDLFESAATKEAIGQVGSTGLDLEVSAALAAELGTEIRMRGSAGQTLEDTGLGSIREAEETKMSFHWILLAHIGRFKGGLPTQCRHVLVVDRA